MISKTNQLELRQLRFFVALTKTLHYRKAAEDLGISQSALSQQIHHMESMLGTKLFDRSNRKVVLNRAGSLFLKEVKPILQQFEQSMVRWESVMKGHSGQITIGFVGSAMQAYLPPILIALGKTHPGIQLQLRELTNSEQLLGLKEGHVDIGFMRSNQVTSDFNIKEVYRENFTLVLPKNHPVNQKNFKNIGQFANAPFILFPNNQSQLYYQQILNLCASYGFSPRVQHQSIHGPTIFRLVENGMGIALIPNSLRDNHNYAIKYIELTEVAQKTALFAVWKGYNENPALHHLLKFI
ncbi:LysR substrate-binding domain-containing protein [Spongiimicrobium salis]|uniref:LysR substrate-binding domain-containing protein n=1 Tax=Spongiimicrobium salis TaxID=1667022 RepID=UPI00374CB05A